MLWPGRGLLVDIGCVPVQVARRSLVGTGEGDVNCAPASRRSPLALVDEEHDELARGGRYDANAYTHCLVKGS